MRGIRMEKDVILYYGNAAGYVSGGKAVVDPLFESQELKDFLDRRKDVTEVKWADGTFDRLMNGQRDHRKITPLKNVRIWQLKPDVDVRMKFIGYDELQERFGRPNPGDYQAVYDGPLDTNDLEEIYEKFNGNHPPGYTGHSLSMSDVVELYDETGSSFHYVDRFGFKQIDFQPPAQTQTMRL